MAQRAASNAVNDVSARATAQLQAANARTGAYRRQRDEATLAAAAAEQRAAKAEAALEGTLRLSAVQRAAAGTGDAAAMIAATPQSPPPATAAELLATPGGHAGASDRSSDCMHTRIIQCPTD